MGIVGFGRFGQLMARHLKDHFDICVFNRSDKRDVAEGIGVRYASLEECASRDIVVPCVPISSFEGVLRTISPHIRSDALVFDVCSVKIWPIKCMEMILPGSCSILGTHPLFGPDTATKGLAGKKVALCPIRGVDIKAASAFMEGLGLVTSVTTPEEHDRQMAHSLALIHFLGNALGELGIEDVELATKTHEKLKDLIRITKNDSRELFIDMHRYNPFVSSVRKEFINELQVLDRDLDRSGLDILG